MRLSAAVGLVIAAGVSLSSAGVVSITAAGVGIVLAAAMWVLMDTVSIRFSVSILGSVPAGAALASVAGTPWHVGPLLVLLAWSPSRYGREQMARWFQRSRLTAGFGLFSAVVGGTTVLGLLLFDSLGPARFNLGSRYAPIVLVSVIVVNAVVEEIVFRGVGIDYLAANGMHRFLAVLLPAIAFGTAHIDGFPSGALGAGMAGVWAVALGATYVWSGSLRVPVLLHIVAGLTVLQILGY